MVLKFICRFIKRRQSKCRFLMKEQTKNEPVNFHVVTLQVVFVLIPLPTSVDRYVKTRTKLKFGLLVLMH